ncbi:hypothetical protein [Burkholderia sp. Ac-20353]|uniref:hypothetical protein n=1 Tax=Burkholderia sp. Ac-20353 TaxID=2703894 RepID=UPI003216D93C
MELLHLAIIIGTITGISKGIQLFNRQCRRRFRYSFFTAQGFWLASVGISFLWRGFLTWGSAFLHHEPTSGGLILMTMGLAAVIWLIYQNVRDTNLPYGAAGSALQLVLFFRRESTSSRFSQ